MISIQADLPIAVDTAGGDRGVQVQIEGAILAYREFGLRSILVGAEEELRSRLELLGASEYPISVVHAPSVIGMDESPTRSIRRKPDSSLAIAYRLLEEGSVSAMISSGNSGAMMAAGRLNCGLLPGIERPAIATLIPSVGHTHPNVILDSGANVECHAHNLVQFAIMGSVYCSTLFKIDAPKVALLSNGAEPSKGTDLLRVASAMLNESKLVNYVGYVEGRDIPSEKMDVIVCDGFVGNVVLKTLEGCVRMIFDEILHEGRKGLLSKMGLWGSRGTYQRVFLEKFDYTSYGGAPLLGLRKLALVLHGSSDSRAVKNAIRVAADFSAKNMVGVIAEELGRFEEAQSETEHEVNLARLDQRNRFDRRVKPPPPAGQDELDDG